MDEIELFEELRAPLPAEAAQMRAAARARLTAAMTAPPAQPARRRNTVVATAAAAALVAAGTGYGLTAARGGPSPQQSTAARGGGGGSSPVPSTAAGLTAVHGCPGMYMAAGTLERVNGTQLIIQSANDTANVTVATSASTAISRPVSGTVSDITDGSQVVVTGAWSGGKLAATKVGIEAALPALQTPFGLAAPHHVRKFRPPNGLLGLPVAMGTVVDAHDGSFTVITHNPASGTSRVQVITSNSTEVTAKDSASPSQLDLGANVVAVGRIGTGGVMTASTVSERSVIEITLAGGPDKVQPSSCSASAIATAAVLAGV